MENNPENKTKFFALYWGQQVFCNGLIGGMWNYNGGNFDEIDLGDYITLKSLSSLSDEDAIEVYLMHTIEFSFKERTYITDISFTNNILCIGVENMKYDRAVLAPLYLDSNNLSQKRVDYLRSKGYAVPWMGLSVEQLVEYGWVKLKE